MENECSCCDSSIRDRGLEVIDKRRFREWLQSKGIKYPNLGVNRQAGNALGVAWELAVLMRKYTEETEGEQSVESDK